MSRKKDKSLPENKATEIVENDESTDITIREQDNPYGKASERFERLAHKEHKKKRITHFIRNIVVIGVVVYLVFGVFFGVAIVSGISMEPEYKEGSVVIINRRYDTAKKNDVVIFPIGSGEEDLIKRVIGTPGDTIDINNAVGQILINGKEQTSTTAIGHTYKSEVGIDFPAVVPNGCVFVLGDNREVSEDSRSVSVGMVKIENIKGKVIYDINF